jgi:endo-1,4-beta-xylanase
MVGTFRGADFFHPVTNYELQRAAKISRRNAEPSSIYRILWKNHAATVTDVLYFHSSLGIVKKITQGRSMRICGFLLSISLAILGVPASSPSNTLRDAADSSGVLIGTAVRPSLFSESAYSATLAREYNMVEPEDAMKWMALRPDAHTFDFHDGDQVVQFAQARGMKVRGHCLVWDHNNPAWLTQGQFGPTEMAALLHEHIANVMKHYAGLVFAWDVINEALDESGKPRNSPWYNQPGIGFSEQGTAYIEQVFRWAREADPRALLFYNEAEGEGMNRKSDAIYAMVKDFRQRGVPIDGVGLQMHIPQLAADTEAISANIARLTALGLQVHITELDVSLSLDAAGLPSADDLRRQADIYRVIATACLSHPGCTAIQTWGFSDKYSWIGWHSHGTRGAALPFDRAYQPKPAYDALRSALMATSRPIR